MEQSIGEGSSMAVMAMKQLGFNRVIGVQRHSFFSLMQKKLVYELDFKDGSFDFVVSSDLDKVSVPALPVLEVERILSSTGSNYNDLIKSATQVSSLLRSSSVVRVGYVDQLNLVMFKKRTQNESAFYQYNMNAGKVEVKFLKDVFESGAICFVDELFLRCPENGSVDDKTMTSKENCMDIYKGLRSNGVYIHQWWRN